MIHTISNAPQNTSVGNTQNASKIKKVAQEFESVLLTSLLEPLQKTFSALPGPSKDAASGEYQSMETQALATALSSAGGLGIANMIARNLLKTQAAEGTTSHKVSLVQADSKGMPEWARAE